MPSTPPSSDATHDANEPLAPPSAPRAEAQGQAEAHQFRLSRLVTLPSAATFFMLATLSLLFLLSTSYASSLAPSAYSLLDKPAGLLSSLAASDRSRLASPLTVVTMLPALRVAEDAPSVAHNCRFVAGLPVKHRFVVAVDDPRQPLCKGGGGPCDCATLPERGACTCAASLVTEMDEASSAAGRRLRTSVRTKSATRCSACDKAELVVASAQEHGEVVYIDSDMLMTHDDILDRLYFESRSHDFLASHASHQLKHSYFMALDGGLLFLRDVEGTDYTRLYNELRERNVTGEGEAWAKFAEAEMENWDSLSLRWNCKEIGSGSEAIPLQNCYTVHVGENREAIVAMLNVTLPDV